MLLHGARLLPPPARLGTLLPCLLAAAQVGGQLMAPRVGGLPELGVVAGRGVLVGFWKHRMPVSRCALALPAPLSLPALQTHKGSRHCLPGCCLPLPTLEVQG